MAFHQVAVQLHENIEEINRQLKQKRLRKYLKLILIGFFIGRDADKRISELKAKTSLILQDMKRQVKNYENIEKRIGEIIEKLEVKEIAQHLAKLDDIERELQTFKEYPSYEKLLSDVTELLSKSRWLILDSVRQMMEQQRKKLGEEFNDVMNSGTYLIYSTRSDFDRSVDTLEERVRALADEGLLGQELLLRLKDDIRTFQRGISGYNRKFVERRKGEYQHLWATEQGVLDDEQQTAIVTDDKHNLVVAAAGAGKTEILTTRIAYLVKRKPDSVSPPRILAIAYQNKDVDQIKRRLGKHGITGVYVHTFHKLGKNILEKSGETFSHVDIIDDNKKHTIIDSLFKHKISNEPDVYNRFLRYAKYFNDLTTRTDKAGATDESVEYAKERSYYAINGTHVKSQAEKEILDFFLTNKLNGEIVTIQYEPDVADFRPDFYLPNHDIFIEHWALNKNGDVPSWFSQTSEEYRKGMEWKKQWFATHRKPLVETFAHEYDERNPEEFIALLRERVLEKLRARHKSEFEFTLLSYEEIVQIVWGPYKDPIEEISQFIKNAKVHGLEPDRVRKRLTVGPWTRKQLAFGHLAVEVYDDYEENLKKQGKIDFEDMINRAVEKLKDDKNLYRDTFDHILIDEYQDISAQRYKLLKALLDRNPRCRLFCVGDDWQSIMAFAGSNLNFFVKFQECFENPAITKIRTNYRSIKTIVDAGADLIKNNGECQISKDTLSKRTKEAPIRLIKSGHEREFERRHHEHIAEDCVGRIIEYLRNGLKPRDILILTRFLRTRTQGGYRFVPIIRNLRKEAKQSGLTLAIDKPDVQNEVRVLTTHKSKGLEAKVVFILNVTKGLYGFPCEIEDPTIYAPARVDYEQDVKREERRLFYVGLTRAKDELILYTWDHARSEFLREIGKYTYEEPLGYKYSEMR